LVPYGNIYLKLTPRNFAQVQEARRRPSPSSRSWSASSGLSHRLGVQLPLLARAASKILATAREALASVPSKDQEWIFARTAQSIYPVLADK